MDDMSVIAYLNRNFMTTKKPLDVQIQEMRDYLAEYILEPSSEIYLATNIGFSWSKANGSVSNVLVPQSIVFKAAGNATLSFNFTRSSTSFTNSLKIYKNSTLITTVSATSATQTVAITNIAKGDVITFRYSATTNEYSLLTLTLSNVNVLASTIYARTLNLIEVI